MNFSDPIADLLTRIRNAQSASLDFVVIPASKIKIMIVNILRREGFINGFRCVKDNKQGLIKISLKYTEEREPVIRSIYRKSKPSLRTFVKMKDIPSVKKGSAVSILSTSKGILTDKEARRYNVGGEYLCVVW